MSKPLKIKNKLPAQATVLFLEELAYASQLNVRYMFWHIFNILPTTSKNGIPTGGKIDVWQRLKRETLSDMTSCND